MTAIEGEVRIFFSTSHLDLNRDQICFHAFTPSLHRPPTRLKRFGDEIFPLWGGLFEPKPRIFWDSKEQLFLGLFLIPKKALLVMWHYIQYVVHLIYYGIYSVELIDQRHMKMSVQTVFKGYVTKLGISSALVHEGWWNWQEEYRKYWWEFGFQLAWIVT